MKNSRRRTSLPAALAAMAVALLLAVVACTTEAPVATEPQAAAETATTTNGQPAYEPATAANTQTASEPATAPQAAEPRDELVARIWVDRDGTVRVNGVAKPVDRVSEAVAPLYSAGAVVSIDAHPAAPYRVVYALQEQLRAAGLLRVVFTTVESEALRPPPRDVSTLLDDGLATVLPEPAPRSEVEVSPRNLLFLEVLPTGIVAARRGEDTSIQEIAPREVEALWHQEVALNPHLIAIVRTHPDAEYRHMYDVVDALHRAKATRYSLQVAE